MVSYCFVKYQAKGKTYIFGVEDINPMTVFYCGDSIFII